VTLSPLSAIEWEPLVLAPLALCFWIFLVWLLVSPWTVLRWVPGGRRLFLAWRRFRIRIGEPARCRETLRFVRRSDDEENERTTPPPQETVTWVATWVAEFYPPSALAPAIEGLRELGWDTEAFRTRDVVAWLERARVGGGLSWASAGAFRPKGATTFPITTALDMPGEFALFLPGFVQPAPGITVLVSAWLLAERQRLCLDQALREPATGTVSKLPHGGHSMRYASAEKAARIGRTREDLRGQAREWIARNIPGAFATQLGVERMPTWDLVTTTSEHAWADRPAAQDWRDTLGLSPVDRWTSEDLPGLSLCFPVWSDAESKPGIVFSGREGELVASLRDFQGADLWAYAQHLHEVVDGLLAIWAIHEAVRGYRRRFAETRDAVAAATQPGLRPVSKQLDRLRRDVLPLSFDVRTTQSAVKDLARAGHHRLIEAPRFEAVSARDSAPSEPFLDRLLKLLSSSAERVEQEVSETTSAVRAFSEALLASANWRLQRTVVWLTVLVALLTAATVYFAASNDESKSPRTPTIQRP
jgi:hypothetical protein